jgi:hypothetical protein
MKLVEINWNPSERQLRQFGVICLIALPLIGWMWSAGPRTLTWLAGVGLIMAVFGWFRARLLKSFFVGLMIVALPIGMVVSELAMLMIYFGVFLPIGLCFKVIKRDALNRELDRGCESYWEEKKDPNNVSSYYRQW